MPRTPSVVVALATVAVVLAACSRKPEPAQPTPGPGTTTGGTTTVPGETDAQRAARLEADRLAEAARLAAAAAANNAAALSSLRTTLQDMIFFDYDQPGIRDDAKSALDRKVPILRANPNVMLRIEGHADERGSVEYNLALSLRRANAIRDYLTGFGIDASRFEVVPMGEERPIDPSQSEEAFARNRRGEFHVTRGGDNLVQPR